MERKYIRQYQNYDTIIPNVEDFPILNDNSEKEIESNNQIQSLNNLKLDDIILLALIVMLLMEENKNFTTIAILGFLFISDYIN